MTSSFARFAGWSACVSAVATVLTFVTTVLFLLVGDAIKSGAIDRGLASARQLPYLGESRVPQTLTWSGIVAGVGYVMLLGFVFGGESSPIFIIGGLASTIGYIAWALALGRLLTGRAVYQAPVS